MPVDNDFQQQRLKAWQPLLTPNYVIGTFFVIGAIFLVIGGVALAASNSVVEYRSERYDTAAGNTVVEFHIDEDMSQPVFLYYELTNFYQNHRRYVKSRSDPQLRGESGASLSSCDPLETIDGQPMYPCGLIANSFFNDEFVPTYISADNATVETWSVNDGVYMKKGIAWSSDVEDKFKPIPGKETSNTTTGYQLPSVDDEDFIVWMRTAGLPTFKKLHRRILKDLKKGDVLQFDVTNRFDVSSFDGEKRLVLSTTSWLGGKNSFLGIAYLVVGGLCVLLAIAFLIKHWRSPRPLGDMKYFNWNTRHASH